MKWGRGEYAALERMNSITREELESMDMTLEFAVEWAEMYEDELSLNPIERQRPRTYSAYATRCGTTERRVMKKTDHETRLRIANTQTKAIRLILEPWGRQYVVRPTDEFVLVFLGPGKSEPEVLVGEDEIEVWGWTGTTVDVFKNGDELTEYVFEELPTVTSK